MSFQAISALWWLPFLGGAIILLYLLKMRRKDMRVPATFLWPQYTADIRANAPFQKLRISLLLLIQLLVVSLLVLAIARPLRKTQGLHGRATVAVLDASASMTATDAQPSRYEVARRRIASIIDTMDAGDRFALIEAGSITKVVFPLSNDKAIMRSALAKLAPSNAPCDMGEALRLAGALVGQQEGGRIVILSDGAFSPVANFSAGKAEIVYDSTGFSGRNLGITALDSAETPKGTQIFVGVRNYDTAPMKAVLSLYADGQVSDARNIVVPPRQTLGQTLSVSPTAQKAEARIAAQGDIMKADDSAALYLKGAGGVRALLVSPGNLFLERAIALEPGVRLDKAAALPEYERAEAAGEGRYDLVIFDGVPPVPVKASAVWSFGGVSASMPVLEKGGLAARPRVSNWKRDHPVMKHAEELESLLIEKAHNVEAKPEGRVLMEGTQGALIVAGERDGQRTLYFGWNLLESDMPLRVAFPILVSAAINWLTGTERAAGGGMAVRTGQPFALPIPDGGAKTLSLQKPNGERVNVDASAGLARLRVADVVGDYALTGLKSPIVFTANLLNEDESDVAPQTALSVSGKSVTAQGSSISLAELWRPIALIALLLLSLEWYVFVRRS